MRFLLVACMLPYALFAATAEINNYEKKLIDHVVKSIHKAENGVSKLNADVLKIPGMSSSKVRHFLNNICSLSNSVYLEIGCWKGSTWISSLFGNQDCMKFAYAIDNWSEFGYQKNIFEEHCNKFLKNKKYDFFSHDAFTIDLQSLGKRPINIYFYDGNHSIDSQELAFTYFNEIFDDSFIAIVDDWNCMEVQEGTEKAFKKLNYEIIFEKILPADYNGDTRKWWNGLYVAVLRKPNAGN